MTSEYDILFGDAQYMSDAQTMERLKFGYPNRNDFSVDALAALDPRFRGIVADAVSEGEQDPYAVYSLLNDEQYQQALLGQAMAGYQDLAARGGFNINPDDSEGEQEDNARNYVNALLEEFYFAAAPSAARNMGWIDEGTMRFGGVPYPGGEISGYTGDGQSVAGGSAEDPNSLPMAVTPAGQFQVWREEDDWLRSRGASPEGEDDRFSDDQTAEARGQIQDAFGHYQDQLQRFAEAGGNVERATFTPDSGVADRILEERREWMRRRSAEGAGGRRPLTNQGAGMRPGSIKRRRPPMRSRGSKGGARPNRAY